MPDPPLPDAESLFRTHTIASIRSIAASTAASVEAKKEDLRQLVGKSYLDLIHSADTIVRMRSGADAVSTNLASVDSAIHRLLKSSSPVASPAPRVASRAGVYAVAARVKYLVDTPESIWGCLDENMLLEASGRYLRAKEVHCLVAANEEVLARFPLVRHQWQIVESFKMQISQRSRDRLLECGLGVGAYADALAAVAVIDDLDPKQALWLFLESRRAWVSQRLAKVLLGFDLECVCEVLCDLAGILRSTLGQVGQVFLQVLNDLPLFYKMVLGSPPGTQLYGGIPNPDEEVRRWKLHIERLESVMVALEPDYVVECAFEWLRDCCREIFGKKAEGGRLLDVIEGGEGLGRAEKLVRETLDSRGSLEECLEQWLKSVFGSEIESPWGQIRGLVLKDGKNLFEDVFEEALVDRMKEIVQLKFEGLRKDVNVHDSISTIVASPGEPTDFQAYLKSPFTNGGVWFSESGHKKAATGYSLKSTVDENDFWNCLNAYLGSEVGRMRDTVDSRCRTILGDVLSFMESQNCALRFKELAPYLQQKCYDTILGMLKELEDLLTQLSASLNSNSVSKEENSSQPHLVIVKRSLFIGRLLFAFRNHSAYIALILGSPRQWVKDSSALLSGNLDQSSVMSPKVTFDSHGAFQSPRRLSLDSPRTPRRQAFDNPRRQTVAAAAALFPADDSFKPRFDELSNSLHDLCIKAHNIWISWVSHELSVILSKELEKDDALVATTLLKGWEVTTIKQDESSDGPLEMKISLPFMPSLYISSFLFQACQEIHRVGGHVLDKAILQSFALKLLEKLLGVYESFLSTLESRMPHVSDKGILQILLDLRFAADVLSGGKDWNVKEDSTKVMMLRSPYRRNLSQLQPDSAVATRIIGLIKDFSQKLDPIDWAIYESYLWENEKQSYKRYAVLFGFLVQLNRMHTETFQKLPTKSNTESNIMRCSTVPRFKYLPISAPALSSRGAHKSSLLTSSDASPRSPWNKYSSGEQIQKSEFDDNSGFDVSTPLLKSFMTQVGSKFGESTSRLGSMLTDAQVGMFRDRSAAAMSTFGDMLPATGLLSSFTAGVSRSDV